MCVRMQYKLIKRFPITHGMDYSYNSELVGLLIQNFIIDDH